MQVTHTFRDSGTLVRQADTVHVQLIMGSCKTLQEVEFRESPATLALVFLVNKSKHKQQG